MAGGDGGFVGVGDGVGIGAAAGFGEECLSVGLDEPVFEGFAGVDVVVFVEVIGVFGELVGDFGVGGEEGDLHGLLLVVLAGVEDFFDAAEWSVFAEVVLEFFGGEGFGG